MIIYFEGPDGSGKTTLITCIYDALAGSGYDVCEDANKMIATHPLEKYRPMGIPRINEKDLYTRLTKMAKDKNTVYLVDRGPISDIIYRVFDDFKTVTTLDKFINWLNKNRLIKIIYCHNNRAEEYMKKRGDDNPVALARHKEITKIYDLVMDRIRAEAPNKIIDYDFTKRNALNETVAYANCLVDLVM